MCMCAGQSQASGVYLYHVLHYCLKTGLPLTQKQAALASWLAGELLGSMPLLQCQGYRYEQPRSAFNMGAGDSN